MTVSQTVPQTLSPLPLRPQTQSPLLTRDWIKRPVLVNKSLWMGLRALADGDPLSYVWSFSSFPNSSGSQLLDSNTVSSRLEADVAGAYVVNLTVMMNLQVNLIQYLLTSQPSRIMAILHCGYSSKSTLHSRHAVYPISQRESPRSLQLGLIAP